MSSLIFTSDRSGSFSTIVSRNQSRSVIYASKQSKIVIEAILFKINFAVYKDLITYNQKLQHLQEFDSLELYYTLEKINYSITTLKVENYMLHYFLEKNDAKLLLGYDEVHNMVTHYTLRGAVGSPVSDRRSWDDVSMTRSIYSSMKKPGVEYHLTLRTRTELAEKICNEVEQQISSMRNIAFREIRKLNAWIDELDITYGELEESRENLRKHLLSVNPNLKGYERQIELIHLFKYFCKNWSSRATNLILEIRLNMTKVAQACFEMRYDILNKAPVNVASTHVDFQLLSISRHDLTGSLYKQIDVNYNLKFVTGNVNRAMNLARQNLLATKHQSIMRTTKIIEEERGNAKLKQELNREIRVFKKDVEYINQLKKHLQRFQAPSVAEYAELKHELNQADREEKMYIRKLSTDMMRLRYLEKKLKEKI
ncbi:uncharacterized protein LOC119687062 [Teleopsis dalmanni]|uniref:uncharacterized protein LOC119687062 n=1 Tax=Teleopsis dalmanni TaxID=139649 RepID=UPI0018CD6052|nr:uncharacterized protein LOC119687062 [Teleopsis dalmanni]